MKISKYKKLKAKTDKKEKEKVGKQERLAFQD
jgi:hypothetical protein